LPIVYHRQGDLEGKANNFGTRSTCHCYENFHTNIRLIANGYRVRAVRIYKYKSIVNGEKERGIIYF